MGKKKKIEAKKTAPPAVAGQRVWVLQWHNEEHDGIDVFATEASLLNASRAAIEEELEDGTYEDDKSAESKIKELLTTRDVQGAARAVTEWNTEIWGAWNEKTVGA